MQIFFRFTALYLINALLLFITGILTDHKWKSIPQYPLMWVGPLAFIILGIIAGSLIAGFRDRVALTGKRLFLWAAITSVIMQIAVPILVIRSKHQKQQQEQMRDNQQSHSTSWPSMTLIITAISLLSGFFIINSFTILRMLLTSLIVSEFSVP